MSQTKSQELLERLQAIEDETKDAIIQIAQKTEELEIFIDNPFTPEKQENSSILGIVKAGVAVIVEDSEGEVQTYQLEHFTTADLIELLGQLSN